MGEKVAVWSNVVKSKTLNLCVVQEGKLFFHFSPGGGGSSGNKREIETETDFLLHRTEYKEIQERPLDIRKSKINILVNDKRRRKNVILH